LLVARYVATLPGTRYGKQVAVTVKQLASAPDLKPPTLRAIRAGWATKLKVGSVNKYWSRLLDVVRFGVDEGLVDGTVLYTLRAIRNLTSSRDNVRPDGHPVAVPLADVRATQAYLRPVYADLVEVQMLTGARIGELLSMRYRDLDRSGPVWTRTLSHHKTSHRGRVRTLHFGPLAQAVLERCPQEGLLFPSPTSGQCLDHESVRKALRVAAAKAGVPRWTPHQLRHLSATLVRQHFGLDGSQVWLGHAKADVTQIYAETNSARAAEIAEKMG
jgi:integrase